MDAGTSNVPALRADWKATTTSRKKASEPQEAVCVWQPLQLLTDTRKGSFVVLARCDRSVCNLLLRACWTSFFLTQLKVRTFVNNNVCKRLGPIVTQAAS